MKKQNVSENTRFWMVIAIMLGIFVLVAGIILVSCMPLSANEKTVVPTEQTATQTGQLDHSYEATKERVDDVNEHYGQSVKASYYGDNSTMESMMRQRMFFFGLKSTFIIVLIALVILLILVKGFNLVLFRKKAKDAGSGEAETPAEKSVDKTVPEKKPQTKKPKTDTTEVHDGADNVPETADSTESESTDADVKEVTESCVLP